MLTTPIDFYETELSNNFIKKAKEALVEDDKIQSFLSEIMAINGNLSAAMLVFDCMNRPYSSDQFGTIHMLADLLSNPLCKVIFNARTRQFSDYSLSKDPLTASLATDLVAQLHIDHDHGDQIKIFFDFFRCMRPFPYSQKFQIEIDMADEINTVLTTFCLNQINKITNLEDYKRTKHMIETLRQSGCNQTVFNQIKYEIAANIEEKDFYSTRTYEVLMNDIRLHSKRPQSILDTFTEELELAASQCGFSTKEQQRTDAQMISNLSPLLGAGRKRPASPSSETEQLTHLAKP